MVKSLIPLSKSSILLFESHTNCLCQFQDELLKAAETGGKTAAAHLQTLLSEYIQFYMPSIPSDVKIVARIYANVRGLANVCVRAGIADNITQVEDFVRGFTRGRTLFDFVDVGSGKDRADEKLIGISWTPS